MCLHTDLASRQKDQDYVIVILNISGLGSTSPRPSPLDEKSELFPMSASGMNSQDQSLSPYEQYFLQQPGTVNSQTQQYPQSGLHSSPQQHVQQSSAFTPIQDLNQMYAQQQSRQLTTAQQYPFPQQQQLSQPGGLAQTQFGIQSLQYGNQLGGQAQSLLPQHSQQYLQGLSPQQQQSQQVMTQAGIMTQQQAASLGVGVVGALSPAQAHMYQQQMALQHQAQHMKKTSRRAHLTGDMRRDGSSTVLIGGQGLSLTPSGMTIGALTPAVVTSLGTFIGGGPGTLGTCLLQQPLSGRSIAR